jgi:hypothetical protein
MKMTLEKLLKLCPETQFVRLIFGDNSISGSADGLQSYLTEGALTSMVINIGAAPEGGILKVWVEEDER